MITIEDFKKLIKINKSQKYEIYCNGEKIRWLSFDESPDDDDDRCLFLFDINDTVCCLSDYAQSIWEVMAVESVDWRALDEQAFA